MGKKKTTKRRNDSDFCAASGKRRYRDARQATSALQSLRNRARILDEEGQTHTIHQRRKYRCEACKGWHLTSWESPTGPDGSPGIPSPRTDPLVADLAARFPHAIAA